MMMTNAKVVFAFGKEFDSNAKVIYDSLINENVDITMVMFVLPTVKRIKGLPLSPVLKMFVIMGIKLLPVMILKHLFSKYAPKLPNIKYVKDINSKKSLSILAKLDPRLIVLYSCGIISKKTCEIFHNVLLNAHAGKLPEYRGVNNIEWCYLENKPLIGTIQFTVALMDSGDIALEEEFIKLDSFNDINEIRTHGFNKTFGIFGKAVHKILNENSFAPTRQITTKRTNRYVMHPYLKYLTKQRINLY